jgi:hypothetical protein
VQATRLSSPVEGDGVIAAEANNQSVVRWSERETMTNISEPNISSDLIARVASYSLGVAALVFVAMLLLAGVHPW